MINKNDNYNKLTILSPFKRWCYAKFPYFERNFDALTNWELFGLIIDYLNKIGEQQNNVNENFTVLQNNFNILYNYVKDYFDNLDVQDEINKKLDDMVESGELQEIVADYLNSKAIFGFDNVESMKNSTNLINGSYARTYGFYSKNDGGGSFYKIRNITNTDVIDNIFIIAMTNNNLVAELIIDNNFCISQIGFSENNSAILNTTLLYNAIKFFKNGGTILLPVGTYNINEIIIDFKINNLIIKSKGNYGTILNKTNDNFALTFNEQAVCLTLENIQIKGNNVSDGIAFNTPSDNSVHSQLNFNNVSCNNILNGFKFLNCLYIQANRITASLSNNANNNNYAVYINNYEYNWFKNCSFQINGDNYANKNIDLFIIENTSWIYIENCEFAKTGGSGIKLISDTLSCNQINICNSIIYAVKKGIDIYMPRRGISNLNINNLTIWLLGLLNTETGIYIHNDDTNNLLVCSSLKQVYIHRIGSVSGQMLTAENNSFNEISLDLINAYNASPNLILNNNIPANVELTNAKTSGTFNLVGNGSRAYNLILLNNQAPLISNKIPQILVNGNDNIANVHFSVGSTWYDNQNRLRTTIYFDEPVNEGTNYELRYRIIF